VQCQAGDERCVAQRSSSYETCVNGLWSGATDCTAPSLCFDYTTGFGRPARVCGVCVPGTHRCTDASGAPGNSGPAIETCDGTGRWSAQVACTVGACATISNNDAACLAQCVPGSTVCLGAFAGGIGANPGTQASGTCTAAGLLPTAPACPGGAGCCGGTTTCRRAGTGVAIGCVDCVGTAVVGGNESGITDTRCTTATGAVPGNAATEVCTATNTWPAAANVCPTNTSCVPPTQQTCRNCFGNTCTESWVLSQTGQTCQQFFGAPAGTCGVTQGCCLNRCQTSGGGGNVPANCQ
jgi:hypothetical protein